MPASLAASAVAPTPMRGSHPFTGPGGAADDSTDAIGGVPQATHARVGVVFNPRSHRNQHARGAAEAIPGVIVASPAKRGELRAVLEGFAAAGVECIAISGGDGTVRDVLTAGLELFGDNWPALAVIPNGKTNALHVDLGAPPNWTVAAVCDALKSGARITRRPLVVRDRVGGGALAGFVLGAGMFTVAISAGQDAHRLGAFNSLAVAATAAWGVVQGLLGSNRNVWRRGAAMRVRAGPDAVELPHAGPGDGSRRAILLAATIERFPFGMKPFGNRHGLKLAVIDSPRRRLLAAVPAMAFGWEREWMERAGVHRLATERVALDLEDRFILDGEAFPGGSYDISLGPELSFVVP
jgi:diacylglycerol kinase (ATP)